MVRIPIDSGVNASNYASMPISLAEWVSTRVGAVWPMVSGAIGALGAFIAGSNTVSNMMLSEFQFGVATKLNISGFMVVALQAVGAAAGNMIAIHNVGVRDGRSVGPRGRHPSENGAPNLYYLLVVGVLGMLAIYVFGVPDPLAK